MKSDEHVFSALFPDAALCWYLGHVGDTNARTRVRTPSASGVCASFHKQAFVQEALTTF